MSKPDITLELMNDSNFTYREKEKEFVITTPTSVPIPVPPIVATEILEQLIALRKIEIEKANNQVTIAKLELAKAESMLEICKIIDNLS